MGSLTLFAVVVACLIGCLSAATYQWSLSQTVVGEAGSYFGSTTVLSPDGLTLFVGSVPAASQGSVSVYTRTDYFSQWTLQQSLMASNNVGNDQFGFSASIALNPYTGFNIAIIGANTINSAYVFAQSASGTWSQTQMLTIAGLETGVNYGFAVGISSAGVAFVGAPGGTTLNSGGKVYVYTAGKGGNFTSGNSWKLSSTLSGNADNSANDGFGTSISVLTTGQSTKANNGTVTVLIGADTASDFTNPLDDYYYYGYGAKIGAAYLFTGPTAVVTGEAYVSWIPTGEHVLLPSASVINNENNVALIEYGRNVIVSEVNGNLLAAVSAPYATAPDAAESAGSVYVYGGSLADVSFNTFNETLFAPKGFSNADYGWSLAFDPSTVTFMVGAPFQDGNDDSAFICGTVYTYIVNQNQMFQVPCPYSGTSADDYGSGQPAFGHAVAVFGSTAIVGAPNANSLFIYTMELANDDDTTSSANQGAVYGGIIGGVLGVGVIGGAVYFGVMGGGAKAAVVENTLNPVHGV